MSLSTTMVRAIEFFLPFTLMGRLCGALARSRARPVKGTLIRSFARCYKIPLDECQQPDLDTYENFEAFFTRRLKAEARPIAGDCAGVCPCDGTVTQAGEVLHGRVIQAKGVDYSLKNLLGGDQKDCDHFENGGFITIYLAPRNYHRVHLPLAGTLLKTVQIPGRHYPVGALNVAGVPGLYTTNERLVCLFETEVGQFAVILVGAALVGSISTTWGGRLKHVSEVTTQYYDPGEHSFERGDEIGFFSYGSTVICLWPEQACTLVDGLQTGTKVQVGERLLL